MGEVFERSGPARLVAGGFWFFLLMILSGFFWLFLGVIVSRSYGPIGFGVASTAQSIYNFIWAFVFGGLFEGLVRYGSVYTSTNKGGLSQYFSSYLKYFIGISFVVFITLMLSYFRANELITKITIFSLAFCFLFSGLKDFLAAMIGALHRSDQLSIVNSSGIIIIFATGLIFTVLKIPFYFLPVLIFFAIIGQLILSIYFTREYIIGLFSSTKKIFSIVREKALIIKDVKKFASLFVFGFYISIGKISFNIMKSMDIALLNIFFNLGDIGIYSVADSASSILFFMTSFSLPIISSISEAYSKKDPELIEEYMEIAVKYPLLIGIPLMSVILTMAYPIIVGIYGFAFQEAVKPLQILIIGTFLLMFSNNLSSVLIGIGKSRLSGFLMALSAVQYITMLLFFTPRYGFIGAALSLTVTGFTSLLLVPYFLKKHMKVKMFSGVHKVFLASIVMVLIQFLVPKSNNLTILVTIVTSVSIFIGLLRLLKYITNKDAEMIKTAAKSLFSFRK